MISEPMGAVIICHYHSSKLISLTFVDEINLCRPRGAIHS